MLFDELQSKFNESKFASTVRPWLAALAASQSVGTGWVFWDGGCCIKSVCLLVCVCQTIRNRYRVMDFVTSEDKTDKSCVEPLFPPFTVWTSLQCTQYAQTTHPYYFGNESSGALGSRPPTVCKHINRSSPAVSEKPHLVLVYSIPPLSSEIPWDPQEGCVCVCGPSFPAFERTKSV